MTKREEVQKFLDEILMPLLQTSETPGLTEVQVGVVSVNEESGVVKLRLGLGKGLGCSPVCGCAAKQLTRAIEQLMMEHITWVTRVVGSAELELD